MFEVFKNAWRLPDLRKKLLYTIFIIAIFRMISYLPIPGVDPTFLADQSKLGANAILGLMDAISGGSLENFTWLALGITPYINASIILQLLTAVIPALEKLSKEGEEGRKKITQYTRYFTIVLALIQSAGIVYNFSQSGSIVADVFVKLHMEWFAYILITVSLIAGAAFAMWLGERLTEKGIGNGISILIFAGIIAKFSIRIIGYFSTVSTNTDSLWLIIPIIAGIILVILAIVFIDLAYRRIPVQYAKKQVGRKTYGGQSTHIPMKMHASGVMPLIFAFSIVNFPSIILGFFQTSKFYLWYESNLGLNSWVYPFALAGWIIFFSYFYNQFVFNPPDVAKNLQQYGGFVPGIRPGKPTADYFSRILKRLTLFGSLFLALLALLPTFVTRIFSGGTSSSAAGLATAFSSTGLLIVVSVALEIAKQLESQMLMRHYKGFLD